MIKSSTSKQRVTRRATATEARGASEAVKHPPCGQVPRVEPTGGQGQGAAVPDRKGLPYFAFYRSYAEVFNELPAKYKNPFISMLIRYAFRGEAPNADTPAIIRAMFKQIRPVMDKSLIRSMTGRMNRQKKRNGSNRKQQEANAHKEQERGKGKEEGRDKGEVEDKGEGKLTFTPHPPKGGVRGGGVKKGPPLSSVHPSLDEILQAARDMEIPEDFAREFFADMEGADWRYVNRAGVTVSVDTVNCRPILQGRYEFRKKNFSPRAGSEIGGVFADPSLMHYD